MSVSVHTIHVPDGWSVEQTWETISRGARVPVRAGEWVTVEAEGVEYEPLPAPETGERIVAGRLVQIPSAPPRTDAKEDGANV